MEMDYPKILTDLGTLLAEKSADLEFEKAEKEKLQRAIEMLSHQMIGLKEENAQLFKQLTFSEESKFRP
jgi:hypothetical protein